MKALKGTQVDPSFSNYPRFKLPTRYDLEKVAFYKASNFCSADLPVKPPKEAL
jgi:hypothetical protein